MPSVEANNVGHEIEGDWGRFQMELLWNTDGKERPATTQLLTVTELPVVPFYDGRTGREQSQQSFEKDQIRRRMPVIAYCCGEGMARVFPHPEAEIKKMICHFPVEGEIAFNSQIIAVENQKNPQGVDSANQNPDTVPQLEIEGKMGSAAFRAVVSLVLPGHPIASRFISPKPKTFPRVMFSSARQATESD